MSHFKERKEKDCLNCGTIVQGRYCQLCGQENIEPKETAWHLVTHFVYDITHFDGKFFSTVKYLIFKPGFLSKEYIKGRRASYLNPIKMYVFISAFFFLYFFSVSKDKFKIFPEENIRTASSVKLKIEHKINRLTKDIKDSSTTAEKKSSDIKQIDSLKKDLVTLSADSSNLDRLYYYRSMQYTTTLFNKEYHNLAEYDSIQNTLPKNQRDGFLRKRMVRKVFEMSSEARKGNFSLMNDFIEKFVHRFPQLLFISLPIFALLLQLLYIRQKRLYVEHTIFTVHLYCAFFILIFFLMLTLQLQHYKYFGWFEYLFYVMLAALYFYQYKAMRTFYGQSRMKTIVKQMIQNVFAFFVMIFLACVLFIISALFI